ncbi:MAG: heme-copper oxidase subunit III [Salinigranum sp.]
MLGDDGDTYSKVPDEVSIASGKEGFPKQSKYPILVALGLFLIGWGLSFPSTTWHQLLHTSASKLVQLPSILFIVFIGVPVFLWGIGGWAYEYAVYDYEDNIIPEQKRELFGMKSSMLATWFLIATESILFGALFLTRFYLQADHGPWPPKGLPPLDLGLAMALAAVLVSSGLTMYLARLSLMRGNRRRFDIFLGITMLLGLGFIGGQVYEYTTMIHEGITPFVGAYGSSFYLVTGTHGLHVIVGLILLSVVAWRAWFKGHFSEKRHTMVDTAAIYWHFVDVMWLLIILFVYF